MKYKILANRVKLIDSHLVPKSKFGRELVAIRNLHPLCPIWQRSEGSIRREWATHNLLYALGIKRSKTADCDLEFEQTWYHKLAYGVIGTVALWVIK